MTILGVVIFTPAFQPRMCVWKEVRSMKTCSQLGLNADVTRIIWRNPLDRTYVGGSQILLETEAPTSHQTRARILYPSFVSPCRWSARRLPLADTLLFSITNAGAFPSEGHRDPRYHAEDLGRL